MASPLAAFPSETSAADPDVDFAKRPYDEADTWPSELGFAGRIGWKRFLTGDDGWTEVSYPDIRWDQLRNDRGWASLQYQAILRNTLTIPSISDKASTSILIEVIQGTEFALIPVDAPPEMPTRWHTGDVYDFANSSSGIREHRQASNFARSLSLAPGDYIILVRAMYEVRMFGDPGMGQPPVIRMKVHVEIDDTDMEVLQGTAIVPDVVDGWTMGEWLSVGVRAPARGSDTVKLTHCELVGAVTGIHLDLASETTLVPGQTRPIAFRLRQDYPLSSTLDKISLRLVFRIGNGRRTMGWSTPLNHFSSSSPLPVFKMTFASPTTPISGPPASVSYAMIVPPSSLTETSPHPPPVVLATHGAGVDAQVPMWTSAMPRRAGSWAVCPTGRTEWGEDWHGGSMADVWGARDALSWVAARLGCSVSEETLLVGHSNGGQGAWHVAARYPDRVSGVIAIAGYLKIQDYVPYTENFSNHFADPALIGILNASLAPYNNDLYASNLADIPVLGVHGSEDYNVPPRHSRAHVAIIAAWEGRHRDIKMIEVPSREHWWDEMFKEPEVVRFIESLPSKDTWDVQRKKGFTLSCANPQECGGRAGIRVLELETPGRLARLDVNARQWKNGASSELDLHGMNIRKMSIASAQGSRVLSRLTNGWKEVAPYPVSRAYGPMIRLLATSAPFTIVPGSGSLALSIAKRIAHGLYLYHRVDSQILDARAALELTASGGVQGSVVVIGRPEDNVYMEWMLAQGSIPLKFPTQSVMTIGDKLVYEGGAGLITLHPHPTSATGLAAIISSNDAAGLELASRLFPIRTGVPIPDWAVVSPRSRWQGAGGLIGAGFWDADWKWSEAMSWMDR